MRSVPIARIGTSFLLIRRGSSSLKLCLTPLMILRLPILGPQETSAGIEVSPSGADEVKFDVAADQRCLENFKLVARRPGRRRTSKPETALGLRFRHRIERVLP